MKLLAMIALMAGTAPAFADIIVPVRNIRAKELINASDLAVKTGELPGVLTKISDATGMEARVALYAGRPMRPGDIGPPALITRNDIVTLTFSNGPLKIRTEGRALDRAASGEFVRVMNISSRTTITGRVRPDGMIEVKE